MKICMIGAGWVGLVSGACFADMGNEVICVDIDVDKITRLRRGDVPFHEPRLRELIEENVRTQRLHFSTELHDAVRRSQVCFITVGTPQGDNWKADTSAVMKVALDIAHAVDGARIVVVKSTVPPRTAEQVEEAIRARTVHPVDVVSNPEFLREGSAVRDFENPDRIVIGSRSARARSMMDELYGPFVRSGNPICFMTPAEAELTKYGSNAFLATRISFINELANLCEKLDCDIGAVRRGMGSDPRIGKHYLFPGCGFGGSCFPKDVRALIRLGEEIGVPLRILPAVENVNETQKHVLLMKIQRHFTHLAGLCLAVWGLAFKPHTDDMREAPSITVIESLLASGVRIRAHDPAALATAKSRFGERVEYHENAYEALRGADGLVILTEWDEYRRPDFVRMERLLRRPLIFDGRNLYELKDMREAGFTYHSIGRPAVAGA